MNSCVVCTTSQVQELNRVVVTTSRYLTVLQIPFRWRQVCVVSSQRPLGNATHLPVVAAFDVQPPIQVVHET